MKNSFIFEQFREYKDDIFCLISTGSYFSDKNITSTGWKDVDIIVVLNQVNLELQKKISKISAQLKKNPGIDISVDIISKADFTHPKDILDLHTKSINAMYEANKNNSRILYFNDKEPIYKLSDKEVKEYTSVAFRELYQEAHKDISRNLDAILHEKDLKVLKRYIKRIFNMIKMSLIYETYEIPLTKKLIVKRAEEQYIDYDFTNTKKLFDIIKAWPSIDMNTYDTVLCSTINDIYNFKNYFEQRKKKSTWKHILGIKN